jgi:hypothetical protein
MNFYSLNSLADPRLFYYCDLYNAPIRCPGCGKLTSRKESIVEQPNIIIDNKYARQINVLTDRIISQGGRFQGKYGEKLSLFSEKAKAFFEKKGYPLAYTEVRVLPNEEHPDHSPPLPLPYKYYMIKPLVTARIVPEKSPNLRLVADCKVCGRIFYAPFGAAVEASEPLSVFGIEHYWNGLYATEKALKEMQRAKLTNFDVESSLPGTFGIVLDSACDSASDGAFVARELDPYTDKHIVFTLASGTTMDAAELRGIPDDWAPLGLDFPRAASDSAKSCPTPFSELYEYALDETGMPDEFGKSDVKFERTLVINETTFWVWRIKGRHNEEILFYASGGASDGYIGIEDEPESGVPGLCLDIYLQDKGALD